MTKRKSFCDRFEFTAQWLEGVAAAVLRDGRRKPATDVPHLRLASLRLASGILISGRYKKGASPRRDLARTRRCC